MLLKVQLPKESANIHSSEHSGHIANILGNVFKEAFEVGFNSLHDNILQETSIPPTKKLSQTRVDKLKDHSMSVMCQKADVDLCSSSPNISVVEKKN